jgi:hypothetical protein
MDRPVNMSHPRTQRAALTAAVEWEMAHFRTVEKLARPGRASELSHFSELF